MKSRITVPGIFRLQLSRPVLSVPEEIAFCHSSTEKLYLCLSSSLVRAYSLPDLAPLCEYATESPPCRLLEGPNNVFVLTRKGVVCLSWEEGQMVFSGTLEGHSFRVNDLMLAEGGVVTCSDDYTLRVWEVEEPFKVARILAGHKGRVCRLEKWQQYIFSGARNGEVALWRDGNQWLLLEGLKPIESLLVCPEAKCLVVATVSPVIEVYDLSKIGKKQLGCLYSVDSTLASPEKRLWRLDDHFITATDAKGAAFVEVFLRQLILKCAVADVNSLLPVNSLLLVCDAHSVYLQDLS